MTIGNKNRHDESLLLRGFLLLRRIFILASCGGEASCREDDDERKVGLSEPKFSKLRDKLYSKGEMRKGSTLIQGCP